MACYYLRDKGYGMAIFVFTSLWCDVTKQSHFWAFPVKHKACNCVVTWQLTCVYLMYCLLLFYLLLCKVNLRNLLVQTFLETSKLFQPLSVHYLSPSPLIQVNMCFRPRQNRPPAAWEEHIRHYSLRQPGSNTSALRRSEQQCSESDFWTWTKSGATCWVGINVPILLMIK